MTANFPPPLRTPLSVQPNGSISTLWAEFFNNVYEGDLGEPWTPVWTNLTETGGAAGVSASISRINKNLALFSIMLTPATSISATAGSTYATGFPLQFLRDSVCNAVYSGVGTTPGHVVASNNRIYIPGLSAVTAPVTITGFGFVR